MIRIMVLTLTIASMMSVARASLPENAYFNVFLNGKEIGWHRYEFQAVDPGYKLHSIAEYQVRYLGLVVYKYQHTSSEHWVDGCLREITSRTNDNGEHYNISSLMTANGLEILKNGQPYSSGNCLRSFAYWQPDLLFTDKLLNSQTGEIVPITVTQQKKQDDYYIARLKGNEIDIMLEYRKDLWFSLTSRLSEDKLLEYLPKQPEQSHE